MGSTIVLKYFPDLSETQVQQFQALQHLYEEWNSKINVISRKDMEGLYLKHVLHSLSIAKIVKFKPDTSLLDVGTGGGFPGIPLAILFPECHFHLVDSIGKKITVVQQVSEALNLSNVKAEQIRAEQLHEKYDFILSRAVTKVAPLYQWVKNKVKKEYFNNKKNGLLLLKGGDLEEELRESKLKYKIFPLSDFFEEEFFDTKVVVYIPLN